MQQRFDQLYPVTATILAAILGMFVLEVVGTRQVGRGGEEIPGGLGAISFQALDALGMLSPADVRRGEVWRLLSCTFLHGGLLHLAFNGYFLFQIGQVCEPSFGRWRYVTVYVVSGLGSSTASMLITGGFSVGASGALCGLAGYLLAHSIRHRDDEQRDAMLHFVIWMVLMSFLLSDRIDHAGHAGGFVTGAVFGAFAGRYTTSDSVRRWRIPGWLAACAATGSVCWAIYNYLASDLGA